MSYFLSEALFTLRAQIDQKWPKRDRRSDGWIGDASHAARKSDHNPDWDSGGIIRAIDVDRDGVNIDAIIETFLNDPRAWYVIWNRRIRYGKYVTGVPQGWRPYSGANAHTQHAHFSVRKVGNFDRQARAWTWRGLPDTTPSKTPRAKWEIARDATARFLSPSRLRKLQAGMRKVFPSYSKSAPDGKYGPKTYAAITTFQKKVRLTPDGIPGPKTHAALSRYGVRF